MYEPSTPDGLSAVLALAARLERDQRFRVREVFSHPVPFVEVKDLINGLVVAFRRDSDYTLYLEVILHDSTGGTRHA